MVPATCNGNKNKLCLSIPQAVGKIKKNLGADKLLRNTLKYIRLSGKAGGTEDGLFGSNIPVQELQRDRD